MRILSIDPGISTGWAYFEAGRLVACGAPSIPSPAILAATGLHPELVVIEKPQVYPRSPAVANDLITLAVQVGRYAERYGAGGSRVALVLPREWKAGQSKIAQHPKIWAALKPAEQDIVSRAGSGLNQKATGDLMDAIGLGLWAKNKDWDVSS